MTVQKNRSDQLIGSNWIRKASLERPTVGCVLPTVGRVLPTVGCGLPAEACPPWVGRGLCRKMSEFSLHEGVRLFGRSAFVFSLNLVGPADHITKVHDTCRKTDRKLLTSGKEYLS